MTKKTRPTILVLEALSGSAEMVKLAGGNTVCASPRDLKTIDRWERSVPDGLLLTGGGDVDPARYGRRGSRYTYGVNETRDLVELDALDWAVNLGLPVLGICRGSQIMNVHAGGTLVQDLPTLLGPRASNHRHGVLPVRVESRTLLAEALGCLKTPVQHLHHQAVSRVGAGYRVSARHADGTIEAIESTDGAWRVGAQFHPEFATRYEPEFGLFRQLVVQAAIKAGLSVPNERPNPTPRPKPQPVAKYGRTRRPATSSGSYSWATPVATRWRCFRCHSMDFDRREDYVDHMDFVHEVKLVDNGRGVTAHAVDCRCAGCAANDVPQQV